MDEYFNVCNNEDEVNANTSCYGNHTFVLSVQDIMALLNGKTLAGMVNDGKTIRKN